MSKKVGQFTVPALAGVQAAAKQIATSTQSSAQAAGLVPGIRQATVVSVDGGTPPTITVTFDGTTNVAGIGYLISYAPAVGDIVSCVVVGGDTWVLGTLANSQYLRCLARSLGTQSVASGSDVDINFDDGEDYDTNGIHSSAVNPSRFTPNVAGYYIMSTRVQFGGNAAGTYRQVKVLKNDAATLYGIARAEQASGGFPPSLAAIITVTSYPVPCNGTSDYLTVAVAHDVGSNLTMNVSEASVYRLYP